MRHHHAATRAPNVIENVGVTARHHTFFSIRTFPSVRCRVKKEAIQWAWELAVEVEKQADVAGHG